MPYTRCCDWRKADITIADWLTLTNGLDKPWVRIKLRHKTCKGVGVKATTYAKTIWMDLANAELISGNKIHINRLGMQLWSKLVGTRMEISQGLCILKDTRRPCWADLAAWNKRVSGVRLPNHKEKGMLIFRFFFFHLSLCCHTECHSE